METLQDIYEKARRLLEETDPPNEPYKSKYAAQGIFEDLKAVLSGILDNESEEELQPVDDDVEIQPSMIRYQLAAVRYHLGVIAVETEELSSGEEQLTQAMSLLEGKDNDSEAIWIIISCYNQLGILWSERDEQKKAQEFLQTARKLFVSYKNASNSKPPKTPRVVFGGIEESDSISGWFALEKLHTLTLYYLAQVLGHLGETKLSAIYCLQTLHRQLTSGDYEPLTWAVNAATLAKFYHDSDKYRSSRHLLAAAWTLIQKYRSEQATESQNERDKNDVSAEPKAMVARCWGKYCIVLLQASFYALGNSSEEPPHQDQDTLLQTEDQNDLVEVQGSPEKFEFTELELSKLENDVPCKIVKDYDDARVLFLEGLKWLNEAKQYYTLEHHASDYTQIIQDMSSLYKFLAEFESAEDRRSKMHKRRVDLLSAVVTELNPQYYLGTVRQLHYELGETHSAMLDCKYAQCGQGGPNQHQANKINSLAKSGIQYFQDYINSFKDRSGKLPDVFPDDSIRPALVAYFHLGRLWSKIVETNEEQQSKNLAETLKYYKCLVEYCQKNPDSKCIVDEEFNVCAEMIRLLPIKIARMKRI